MRFEQMTKHAAQLVRRIGGRDPFVAARELGIEVLYNNDFTKLKGMYRVIKRNRFIFLNANLNEQMLKIVCAHEIGHDQYHRKLATGAPFQEFMLYQMNNRMEYEANIFAAEFLLESAKVLECIDYGYDLEMTAGALRTDINLVALKLAHLKKQGYAVNTFDYPSDFLK